MSRKEKEISQGGEKMAIRKKCKNLILAFSLLACMPLLAQEYTAGFQQYLHGNFQQAKEIFIELLTKHPTREKESNLYKMKGLCEFMQGDRAAAAKSLEKAKGLQPHLQLSSQEILDQSVLDFFASIPTPEEKVAPLKQPKAEPIVAEKPVSVPMEPKKKAKKPVPTRTAVSHPVVAPSQKKEPSSSNKKEIPASWLEESTHPHHGEEAHKEKVQMPHHEGVASSSEQEKKTEPLPSKAYYFLPFGVGQYLNHEYKLGVASTVAQVASLYIGWSYYNTANGIVDDTNNEVAAREKIANTQFSDRAAQTAYYQTQIVDYKSEQTKKSDKEYNDAYLMLGLFTSVWISSVVESLLHRTGGRDEAKEKASPLSHADKQHFSLQIRPNPHTFSLSSSAGMVTWTVLF